MVYITIVVKIEIKIDYIHILLKTFESKVMMVVKPYVSVLTPTYNRRRFIPSLIECFKHQTYPQDRIEWIIFDDGTDKVKDLFEGAGLNNVRYYSEDIKLSIGAKRNKLNALVKGAIVVCMDDDDYYPPDRISHAVNKLTTNPKYNICGSSELYLFYSDNKTIYKLGPYNSNHATNGTFAYKSSYIDDHKYDEKVSHGEESSFLNKYTEPLLQLDPFKAQLLMSHSENTFDKKKLREQNSPVFQITKLRLDQFINNKNLFEFYNNA
jgi:glycosyltransferase involved in cell wall biosynthesis